MNTLLGLLIGFGLEIVLLAFPAWLRHNSFKQLHNDIVLGGRVYFTNNTPEKRTKAQNIALNTIRGATMLCAMYLSGVVSFELTTGEPFVEDSTDFGKEMLKEISVNSAFGIILGYLGMELAEMDTLLVSEKGVLFPGRFTPFKWNNIATIEFDADKGQMLYGINIRLKNNKVEKIWLPKSTISRVRELLQEIISKVSLDVKLIDK